MSEQKNDALSEDERAELEALRAEKAKRQASAERAELERLRQEEQQVAADAERDRQIDAARAQGRKLMEPDDDLKMPVGQKIVLGLLALIVIAFVIYSFVH